jgi:hypothetical protein
VGLASRGFEVRERWEGTVQEVFETYFAATTINLATDEAATVEIVLDDVNLDDRRLVEPGALFYWNIGYETLRGHATRRVQFASDEASDPCEVRFRRMRQRFGSRPQRMSGEASTIG